MYLMTISSYVSAGGVHTTVRLVKDRIPESVWVKVDGCQCKERGGLCTITLLIYSEITPHSSMICCWELCGRMKPHRGNRHAAGRCISSHAGPETSKKWTSTQRDSIGERLPREQLGQESISAKY